MWLVLGAEAPVPEAEVPGMRPLRECHQKAARLGREFAHRPLRAKARRVRWRHPQRTRRIPALAGPDSSDYAAFAQQLAPSAQHADPVPQHESDFAVAVDA